VLIFFFFLESVQQINKFSVLETCTNDIEEVIKYVLIQSPFKIKKKPLMMTITANN